MWGTGLWRSRSVPATPAPSSPAERKRRLEVKGASAKMKTFQLIQHFKFSVFFLMLSFGDGVVVMVTKG